MKCVQMLDWHHKHSPPPHTVCLISQNQEESVQHVVFSAWWCQSFQGLSGSLYKHVCSEETKRKETNAAPMEIHIVPFSVKNLAWIQHHAVHLKVKCVIFVLLAVTTEWQRFCIDLSFACLIIINSLILLLWSLCKRSAFADLIQKSPCNVFYWNRKQEIPPTNFIS